MSTLYLILVVYIWPRQVTGIIIRVVFNGNKAYLSGQYKQKGLKSSYYYIQMEYISTTNWIKTEISNLVRTTRFCNNLHQVWSNRKKLGQYETSVCSTHVYEYVRWFIIVSFVYLSTKLESIYQEFIWQDFVLQIFSKT
jgi:hypothetical protein